MERMSAGRALVRLLGSVWGRTMGAAHGAVESFGRVGHGLTSPSEGLDIIAGRRSPVAGRRSPVAGRRSPVAGRLIPARAQGVAA